MLAVAVLFGARTPANAQSEPPPSKISPELARLLVNGDVRLVVVGDSISTGTPGAADGSSHTPMLVGMHRVWRPKNWHAIWVPVAAGVPGWYDTTRGVGATTYDNPDTVETVYGLSTATSWPWAPAGFGTDTAIHTMFPAATPTASSIPRSEFRLYGYGTPSGSIAGGTLLASPTLRGRHFIYTNPGASIVPSIRFELTTSSGNSTIETQSIAILNTQLGWAPVDFDIAALLQDAIIPGVNYLKVRTLVERPTTAVTAHYVSQGMLFYDPATPGMQIHAIAQGGWTNDDHLRIGGNGFGYSDLGLQKNLLAYGLADPGVTPVVMIATGANLGILESANSLYTETFRNNIAQLMARYRAALSAIGSPEPWFILVGMYSMVLPPPDAFAQSRASWMWEVARDDPRCAFFNLPALTGARGDAFQSAWYFWQTEALTTAPYTGGPTLQINSLPPFPIGRIWATDGTHSSFGTFESFSGASLTGVTGLESPLATGARVLGDTFQNLHLSLPGAEATAGAMWSAITQAAATCNPDFDADGDTGTDDDIEAFFRCLSGVCCPSCGSADFDGDGDTGTDDDIETFFRVLAGGAC